MQAACVAALTVSVMLSGDRMDVSAQNTAESVQESYTEEELELQTLNEEEDDTEPEVISDEMVEENDRDITENFPEGSDTRSCCCVCAESPRGWGRCRQFCPSPESGLLRAVR